MKKIPLAPLLLPWFDRHGRHDLPWQENKTPYRVWVSEIMLQQTQVNTVIPYYLRFMQQFPNVETLAEADEDVVLHYWSGLGYYRRAKYLHHAAKMIVQDFQGKFPNNLIDLQKLPGIGRSTAGAILSIAWQKPATILDGNVRRVLTRLLGMREWVDDKILWPYAEQYTPKKRTGDYTQAIMDLGATICTRSKPQCLQCPCRKICVAYRKDLTDEIPVAKPRKAISTVPVTFLLLCYQDTIFLQKRESRGIWADLWSLPQIEGHATPAQIKRFCKMLGFTYRSLFTMETLKHTFTHFHYDILPIRLEVVQNNIDQTGQIWYNTQQPTAIGIPAPVKILLDKVNE